MITVSRRDEADGIHIQIAGTIEESVNLDAEIGPVSQKLYINCKGILRINSVGVKAWIVYFQKLRANGISFQFEECSPPIVDQMNMISNFSCGGPVLSILLPFSCTRCNKEFMVSCPTERLKATDLQVPPVKCEQETCGAVFDDDPDEYFSFLDN